LPPRVTQDVAEQVDASPAFVDEVDILDGVINLGLGARCTASAHNCVVYTD
jgi:hypothetical protein